jgi:hypothetical protein
LPIGTRQFRAINKRVAEAVKRFWGSRQPLNIIQAGAGFVSRIIGRIPLSWMH